MFWLVAAHIQSVRRTLRSIIPVSAKRWAQISASPTAMATAGLSFAKTSCPGSSTVYLDLLAQMGPPG